MEYTVHNKKLIWEFDPNESSATKLKENNLYIPDVWYMQETVGYSDACVGVSILSEDTFYFVTFQGLGFTMTVTDSGINCIKKQITK